MNDYLVRLARDFLLSTYLPSVGTYSTPPFFQKKIKRKNKIKKKKQKQKAFVFLKFYLLT